jgi:hypothetical protein
MTMITEFTSVDELLKAAKESLERLLKEDVDAELDADIAYESNSRGWDDEKKKKKKNDAKRKMAEEVFTVKDLFTGIEWKRIPLGKRIQLGSRFFSEVNNNKITGIWPTDKTTQNQQQYKKFDTSQYEPETDVPGF